MVVGYTVSAYSYGTGPCRTGSGFLIVPRLEDECDRADVMIEILRREMAASGRTSRITSVMATLFWGEGRSIALYAGLFDRNLPSRAPWPHQVEEMDEFRRNVWVGDEEPTRGVFGTA